MITNTSTILLTAILAGGAAATASAQNVPPHALSAVPIQQLKIDDGFWSPKLKLWREVMIGDCFTKFENDRGGALNNFDRVRDGKSGGHAGPPWYDGLVYEMIRGSADFLAETPDPALEKRLDGYIARIAAAQAVDPDGYINTWTQLEAPAKRWGLNGGNDVEQHDVYNAGCLIEAGVHYYRATGKTTLLKVAARLANDMCRVIGPAPRKNVIPGHAIAEEALVRMYELFREQPGLKAEMGFAVDEASYLKLSEFFIEARGHHEGRTNFKAYDQDNVPVFQQQTIEGHAVRATLMATGVAALARVNQEPQYYQTAQRLWDDMAGRKLYITGGVGATSNGEAFGPDYDLPNNGYLETCAAVGGGFFSRDMNLAFGDARYVDEMETVLYNGALGHVSQAGNTYSYENPLSFDRGHARWSWHDCPCCPPMFLKMMGALPGYIYAQDASGVYVNLFIANHADVTIANNKVKLAEKTRYPWDGAVEIAVDPEKEAAFDVCVRVPEWCQAKQSPDSLYMVEGLPESRAFSLKVNGQPVELAMSRGYARISRTWKKGDIVSLAMQMPIRRVRAPKVSADAHRVALQRGPVVYAFEPVNAPVCVDSLFLPPDASLAAEYRPNVLGGVTVINCALKVRGKKGTAAKPVSLAAIPYYAYLNRGPSDFRVWIPEAEADAVPATLARLATPTASHFNPGDPPRGLNDGIVPQKSSDVSKKRMTWWDHKGMAEWVQYDFPQAMKVSRVRVYWFADRTVKGGCDLPQSWRLLYKQGDVWKPVEKPSDYGVAADQFNETAFTPVTTSALRLEVQLKPNWSGGIWEWEVE
ncbi:MAG TPA: beta-L-arabinofuranosidase domain-containing protein [Tepidisphaeraceae bacterium]|jgi:DUF1680 family protein|nr:beta-L-arabinofuranosidase domain-containing protein [Tepidisphaeraceae bacterium]